MAKGDEPRARHIHAQDLIRRRNEVTAVMAQLTDDWCHEIARRSRMSPGGDGYRSTSGSGSTHSGIGNPTEVTVLSQWIELKDQRTGLLTGEVMLRKPEPDPQQQAGERLRESLGAAYREANTMKRALSLIRFITDGRRGRETTIAQCQACGRDVSGAENDRLRSGYCDRASGVAWSGCVRLWYDQGRPDRPSFERWVRGELDKLREAMAVRA